MITGVIGFSFATGSLSSIMSNYDQTQAIIKQKIQTLNKIDSKYELSLELYEDIRKIIKYDNTRVNSEYF